MSIRFCILALVIMVVGTVPSSAGGSKDKDKYHNIIVTRFDIQDGVNFPPDYLVTMTDELVKELQGTKTFKQVLREGEQPDNKDVSTIKLLGTVTHFDKGSRAKRYLVGFGAGKTKVRHISNLLMHPTMLFCGKTTLMGKYGLDSSAVTQSELLGAWRRRWRKRPSSSSSRGTSHCHRCSTGGDEDVLQG